ncbi:MAG TPA: HAMP domain-containing sensor histidine kinase [Solirubrobacterales bacterium]|nr:HAMP domain-containing sensor histidine kinase [Solirubrobacterales bacterium]
MSLRARLLAAFAYTLLIVIVALEVPLAANLSDRVNAEVEADSAAQAQVVAASIADQLERPARLRQVTNEAADSLDGLVFVIDARGRPIAVSGGETTPSSTAAPVDDPIALQALRGEIEQGRHHEGRDVLSTAVPIVRNGRTVGALEVEQSLDSVNDEVRQDVAALIGIGALALALGLGVAWILAGSISRPLNALAATARRRAEGDVDARAEPRGSSEQVEVANAFNEMAERLGAMLESQRAFVADASHQLRTPLTGLRLRLEAAGVKTSDPAVARELEAAERETERLDELVADLLELASSEQLAADNRADLSDAAREAAERWRGPASESRHEIVLDTAGPAAVRAAANELAAILDNLVENAIKYSPRGSPVTIECERVDGMASVAVLSESGPLDAEVASHAFERFYRGAANHRSGTGLGLPIVAALAKRRGGRATLENVNGGLVRAEVSLPVPDLEES